MKLFTFIFFITNSYKQFENPCKVCKFSFRGIYCSKYKLINDKIFNIDPKYKYELYNYQLQENCINNNNLCGHNYSDFIYIL